MKELLSRELITPEKAAEMLKSMIKNQRFHSQSLSNNYATEMAAGRWRDSYISIDISGDLIDGQHRLFAVIKSKTPIEFLVIRGVRTEMAEVLDIGHARCAADIACIKGHEWVRKIHISTMAQMLISPTTKASVPVLSHELKIQLLLKHREAITFALEISSGKWKRSAFPAVIARAYYSQNRQRLEEFAQILSSGVCRCDGDMAAIALRDLYLKESADGKLFKGGSVGQMALIRFATNSLKNFIGRKSIKTARETNQNYFPVADLDDWWKSKLSQEKS